MRSERMRWAALLMFVMSGAAGLVFEVAMQRSLTRVFGVSAFATSTVLAAWMGGIALGAVMFGRLTERVKSPLRLYAWLEIGIALCAFVVPVAMPPLMVGFSDLAEGLAPDAPSLLFMRLALAFAVTLVPTLLMGGTLPAVARALGEAEEGAALARLYTANLLGAVSGAALGSYVLMPTLGLTGTQVAGGALNLAAAALAFVIARHVEPPPSRPPQPISRAAVLLLLLSAWSGLATFCAEVTWFHLLSVVVGNSVYAFGAMLATFLTGLALGSAWLSRQPQSRIDERLLGKAQLVVALGILVTLPLWDKVPTMFLIAGKFAKSFPAREAVRTFACFELMLLPSIALGTVFPLVLRAGARPDDKRAGVGGLSAANTLGAIIGSLVTGFVLLPAFGSRAVLLGLLCISALLGAVLLRGRWRGAGVAVAVAALLMPGWNLGRLASGINVYFSAQYYADGEVQWLHESIESGLTSVVRNDDALTLLTNGKFQGNDVEEVPAQLGFAQLPMLVQHRWDSALVIGLGTGTSLGAIAAQPYKEVDLVELSGDIVYAARTYFGHVNDGVLNGGRVRVTKADARNFLLLSKKQFDLISIEISSIWFAGAGDLYNREFYALMKSRLSERGILQQWVQLHHITRRNLAVVLATLRTEFPHVALYEYGEQGIILASAQPLSGDYEALTRISHTAAARGIKGGDTLTLGGRIQLDARGIDGLIEEERKGTPMGDFISTDDSLRLEYSTPRGNADESLSVDSIIESIRHLSRQPVPIDTTSEEAQHHVRGAWAVTVGRREEAVRELEAGGEAARPLLEWLKQQPPPGSN